MQRDSAQHQRHPHDEENLDACPQSLVIEFRSDDVAAPTYAPWKEQPASVLSCLEGAAGQSIEVAHECFPQPAAVASTIARRCSANLLFVSLSDIFTGISAASNEPAPSANFPSELSLSRRYSMTSSARPSSMIGKVRPSALAAFRLRVSVSFVAHCTGKSAGFSPLRIRPT